MQVTALSVRIKIVKVLHLFSQPLPAAWPVSSRSQQVTAMAMRRDGPLCQESWGYNSDGQLGDAATTNSDVPVSVLLPAGLKAISIGSGPVAEHSFAVVRKKSCRQAAAEAGTFRPSAARPITD